MKIQIIGIPAGEAPKDIREQWIGLVLPVDASLDFETGIQEGVLGGPPALENLNGFPVKFEDAIRALKETGKIRAALWWENNNIARAGASHLVFGWDFCELL